MNCLKIIATYLGPRRQNNNNFSSAHQAKEYLNYSLNEIEANIDPGIKMDVLIVNNCDGNEESKNFINFFNNKKLKKGSIFVSHRENDGGSFAAFSHGYSLFEDKYEYFIFNEDDDAIFIVTEHVARVAAYSGIPYGGKKNIVFPYMYDTEDDMDLTNPNIIVFKFALIE
jgi:hypothetical protein